MGAELSLTDVRHVRGGREVLRVDSLVVGRGEHLSVLGPNGAGKSTLLRLLAAVESPHSGDVTVDGVSTRRGGVELRRRVAYATQRPGLLNTSVRRNVELPLRWRKVPRTLRGELALAALERLKVAHLADRPAGALSGGEQQRVSLARALAIDPAVLLLDEPAAGLDAQSRSAFFADLEQALADRATTVVQVSHRAEEALRLADRVVVLVDGLVHQVGSPDVLNRFPADARVAALVGYENLVDAHVESDGSVLIGQAPTGLTSPRAVRTGDGRRLRQRCADRGCRCTRPARTNHPGDAGARTPCRRARRQRLAAGTDAGQRLVAVGRRRRESRLRPRAHGSAAESCRVSGRITMTRLTLFGIPAYCMPYTTGRRSWTTPPFAARDMPSTVRFSSPSCPCSNDPQPPRRRLRCGGALVAVRLGSSRRCRRRSVRTSHPGLRCLARRAELRGGGHARR